MLSSEYLFISQTSKTPPMELSAIETLYNKYSRYIYSTHKNSSQLKRQKYIRVILSKSIK